MRLFVVQNSPAGTTDQQAILPSFGLPFRAGDAHMLNTLKPRVRTLNTIRAATDKRTDPFYATQQWRDARAEAKVLGAYVCSMCGARGVKFAVDHVIELQDGGSRLSQPNLALVCYPCHSKKTIQARAARLERQWGRG